MTACAGGDRDDAIDAHFSAFARVPIASDIVEDEPAISMNGLDDFRICREGENHDWNPMGEDHLEVGAETGVGPVSDKVDGVGNFAVLQRPLDSSDIGVQGFGRASIERRHRAYDSTPALRDHQS